MRDDFKTLTGFPEYYINSEGIVKNKNGYILKQRSDKDGYKLVTVRRKNMVYTDMRVHRGVLLTFKGNPKNLPIVNHLNGIKYDNRLENLEWATHRENLLHGFEIGTNYMIGKTHANAKKYKVYLNDTLIGRYTNMHEVETSLDTSREIVNRYIRNNKLFYDYFKIERVEEFSSDTLINTKIVYNKKKSNIINPIKMIDVENEEEFIYSSIKELSRELPISEGTIKRRIVEEELYDNKYKIVEMDKFLFLTGQTQKEFLDSIGVQRPSRSGE